MSVKRPGVDGHTERCQACDQEVPHDVRIEIVTESRQHENAQFSREPYRIATCSICGEEQMQRMNNA